MSNIFTKCQHCGKSLEAPEEMSGQVVECPLCDGQNQLSSQLAAQNGRSKTNYNPLILVGASVLVIFILVKLSAGERKVSDIDNSAGLSMGKTESPRVAAASDNLAGRDAAKSANQTEREDVRPDDNFDASKETFKKLQTIIVRSVEFENPSISDAVNRLSHLSRQYDPSIPKVGVSFIVSGSLIKLHEDGGIPPVTMQFDNIPMLDIIRYYCDAAGVFYVIMGKSVVIGSLEDMDEIEPNYADVNFLAPDDSYIMRKLNEIVIPHIEIEDVTVSTIFAYLKQVSKQLDPDGFGVNFSVLLPFVGQELPLAAADDDWGGAGGWGDEPAAPAGGSVALPVSDEPTVTMVVDDIPLLRAVQYICRAANLRYQIEQYAVVIFPPGLEPKHRVYFR